MKHKFSKLKSIILGLIIFLCIFLIFFYKSTIKDISLNTTYFKISVPSGWTLSSSNGDCFNRLIHNQEDIASIEVFPNCEFNSSNESIVSNIYGVHAYILDTLYTKNINDLTLSKVIISFEQSAAESYSNISPETNQLHYFYTANGMLIDFFVHSDSVDQTTIDNIANSLTLKH